MVAALFGTEISSLESQIAQFQAQIAQAEARIVALGDAEMTAAGALQALQNAVAKISGLVPDAISSFKQAALNLIQPSLPEEKDNQRDSSPTDTISGNVPKLGIIHQKILDMQFVPNSQLSGQTCEIDPEYYWYSAEPDGSAWEIASPVACLLEDAPSESLTKQFVEITCDREDKGQHYIELVKVTDAVAYQRRFDGRIICVYIGGNQKRKLKAWGEWLTTTHSVTRMYELREATRVDTKWELKLSDMSISQIEKLAECDFNLSPQLAFPAATKSQPCRVPRAVEIENIRVGDFVRSLTVRSWEYKVLEIIPEGFYVCERLGTRPRITQTLHLASIELVGKGDAVDVASSELAIELERQTQDAINSIQFPEYSLK